MMEGEVPVEPVVADPQTEVAAAEVAPEVVKDVPQEQPQNAEVINQVVDAVEEKAKVVYFINPKKSAPEPIFPVGNYFKASQFPQPAELSEFLKQKLANPFNKYCIDCKKNQTTHALIWLGAFVCESCAAIHRHEYGGQSQTYVKDVYKDHWDDYQLKSIQIGGNKPLFEILKEYGMENAEVPGKYKHSCITWYRKSHLAKMDGIDFTTHKPPKDWNERVQLTKSQLSKESVQWSANLKVIGGAAKEGGGKAAAAIAKNTSWLTQKLAEKKLGEKIKGMMAKKDGVRGSQSVLEPSLVESENAVVANEPVAEAAKDDAAVPQEKQE